LWIAALLCPILSFPGCNSHPQVGGENRELITSLATAVSGRNPQWLAANRKLIEQRIQSGALGSAEAREFTQILDLAAAGKWKEAEDLVYALRESQNPSGEDLGNVSQRRLAPDHGRDVPAKTSRRNR
jgi:hypothetical protein